MFSQLSQVVDEVRTGTYRQLFHPEQLISGKEDRYGGKKVKLCWHRDQKEHIWTHKIWLRGCFSGCRQQLCTRTVQFWLKLPGSPIFQMQMHCFTQKGQVRCICGFGASHDTFSRQKKTVIYQCLAVQRHDDFEDTTPSAKKLSTWCWTGSASWLTIAQDSCSCWGIILLYL